MSGILALPLDFFRFWYYEAPGELIGFFASLNKTFFQLFSLPLLLRTFFQPLKNEYRKGLVGFSIGMGIAVKSCLIIVDLLIFGVLIILEVMIFVFVLFFPLLPIFLFFV